MMNEHVEPHFDDEQTILSARPVVPLEKIEAKTRHRRIWLLSAAFVFAMMLGSASALLALYLTHNDAPQTVTELPVEPDIVPEPVIVAESVPNETPVVAPVVENEESSEPETLEDVRPETPNRESASRRGTVAPQPNEEPDEPRDTRRLSEEDELQRTREAVLYDQWQERRARRTQRRERRRAERYNDRDLSNLNEIFEGRGRRRP